MRVIHLGGSHLGDRIRTALSLAGDTVVDSVVDKDGLERSLRHHSSIDWLVSAGFRYIVPERILKMSGDTCNVHTSFLPFGKGCYPNVWAIACGEPAGVSIHRMTSEADGGPIFVQERVHVKFTDTAADVYARLEEAAVELFSAAWPDIRDHTVSPRPQAAGGTYHSERDFARLREIDPDAVTTWRDAIALLRALSWAPYDNIVISQDGRRYGVRAQVYAIDEEVLSTEGPGN